MRRARDPRRIVVPFAYLVAGILALAARAAESTVTVTGAVVDASTGVTLPARVYVRSAEGAWFFPRSAAPAGSAIPYRHQVGTDSVELHTTLSAHPFSVELPPGRYIFSAEHGKEFLPGEQALSVGNVPTRVELKLKRWIDMAERGWFSGDTHSHRPLTEMTNLLLAEDLNIGFPLSHWVTRAEAPPATANQVTAPVPPGQTLAIDSTHLLYPLNTEFEIVNVGGKPHTLGAFLVLGQKTTLASGVPPVAPTLAQARREGALIELEKHSWPWTIAMAAALGPDLFELANNHLWRVPFGFPQWTVSAAGKYMNLEMDARGFTEWGWIDFGFQTYYALLNCGLPMRVTGGSGSGVHPVPLGFGRVYARQPNGFSYENWLAALRSGDSFVTTGPMLFVQVNDHEPGTTLQLDLSAPLARVTGSVESATPLEHLEIIVNGRIVRNISPVNRPVGDLSFTNPFAESVPVASSGWVAVRAFEANGGRRSRFAHSNPVFLELPGRPLRPRHEEIDYLIQRVQEEIARNESFLPPAALDEYQRALKFYQAIKEATPGRQPSRP